MDTYGDLTHAVCSFFHELIWFNLAIRVAFYKCFLFTVEAFILINLQDLLVYTNEDKI